jgi:DNA-directed RNA polymerase specialized sigma24 family protein
VTYEESTRSRLQALLRYALMLTGDPHTAQDLVQETMIRVQLKWRPHVLPVGHTRRSGAFRGAARR